MKKNSYTTSRAFSLSLVPYRALVHIIMCWKMKKSVLCPTIHDSYRRFGTSAFPTSFETSSSDLHFADNPKIIQE